MFNITQGLPFHGGNEAEIFIIAILYRKEISSFAILGEEMFLHFRGEEI